MLLAAHEGGGWEGVRLVTRSLCPLVFIFFSVGFNLRRGARKAMLAAAFPLVCWMRWRE
jgi:hypothetical protein